MNKQKTSKALDALWRIFDNCEEIQCEETEGYRMLDDIHTVRNVLESKHEAEWELVYHDDQPSYYAHYVTARCGKCKHWFEGNKEYPGAGKEDKYGARIWSAFCVNYDSGKILFKSLALDGAEKEVLRSDGLPKFCEHCGARMRGVRTIWSEDRRRAKA